MALIEAITRAPIFFSLRLCLSLFVLCLSLFVLCLILCDHCFAADISVQLPNTCSSLSSLSCSTSPQINQDKMSLKATKRDGCSHSNVLEFATQSLVINITTDFERKVIDGYVDIHATATKDGLNEVILDTRQLTIAQCSMVSPYTADLQFVVEAETALGSALKIKLSEPLAAGTLFVLRVVYETSPEGSALQWLDAQQTADKKHPFLFTQCQAIHARSLVPCQDSPSTKVSYKANVTVPNQLVALMSALADGNGAKEDSNSHTYSFNQPIPIPTYLIALVVGHLESRTLSTRSKVWAEPSVVELAASEFQDTEKFIQAGESLLGPYEWTQYDILVLPPSFPYGGMENPCLTFVTPTLLAGDRSLVDVIAHEITHSWMGNLVTNAIWDHFWLNEGFTMFIERKIHARVEGVKYQHYHAFEGQHALKDSIKVFGDDHPFTALVPNLDGIDPDDAFSSIPYEKGFTFLWYLEKLVGIPDMEKFLYDYVQKFRRLSITTDDMKSMFLERFGHLEAVQAIEWDKWLFAPGYPPVEPEFDRSMGEVVDVLLEKWFSGSTDVSENDLDGWVTLQKINFLESLLSAHEKLSVETLGRMDALYKFTSNNNSEIKFRWYRLAIRLGYEHVLQAALKFLASQGRMKYVRPLYREMYAKDGLWRSAALSHFKEIGKNYHFIAFKMISKDLNL